MWQKLTQDVVYAEPAPVLLIDLTESQVYKCKKCANVNVVFQAHTRKGLF